VKLSSGFLLALEGRAGNLIACQLPLMLKLMMMLAWLWLVMIETVKVCWDGLHALSRIGPL
jgi:hypothetical protein